MGEQTPDVIQLAIEINGMESVRLSKTLCCAKISP